ncbi:dehydrosqualene synthase, partial [Staphylococcus aureus]|nr:dehydrosqualene synthase [Staphylococcus aureus]
KEAQPIIELASIIYRGILDEVRKASYTLHRRVYVSKLDKVKMYKTIKKKYHL